jgi:hypothetical protein
LPLGPAVAAATRPGAQQNFFTARIEGVDMSALFASPQSDSDDLQNGASLANSAPPTPDVDEPSSESIPPDEDDASDNSLHVWAQHAPAGDETQDGDSDDEQKLTWHPFNGQLNAPASSLLGDSRPAFGTAFSNPLSPSGNSSRQWSLEDLITQQAYSPITRPSPSSIGYSDLAGGARSPGLLSNPTHSFDPFESLSGSTGIQIPRNPPAIQDSTTDEGAYRPDTLPRNATKYAQNFAVQNHPVIDSTTEILLAELAASLHKFGTGFGSLFGIKVHTDFAKRVRELNLPGIGKVGIEQSFSFGELANYGAKNSIRTDIFLRDKFGEPLAIYDVKTGNARLTPARVRELLEHVKRTDNPIPIIQLNFNAGTAILP